MSYAPSSTTPGRVSESASTSVSWAGPAPTSRSLRVRTPAGTFEVETDRLARRPQVEMTRRSRAVECPRLRADSDPAAARAVITIPTSCLDDPRWVKVGAGIASVESVTTPEGVEQALVLADDAHRVGEIRDAIAFGPKVRRG